MSEKIPRIKPHTMQDLGRLGVEMYGPKPPLKPHEARRIGQMSITDGMPIVHEVPEPEVLEMDVEAERPGNTWNWSR